MVNCGFRQLSRLWMLAAVLLTLGGSGLETQGRAQETAVDEKGAGETFETLVEQHTKRMFDAVVDYVTRHPEADDARAAYLWLFQMAQTHDYEEDVAGLVDRFLDRPDADPASSLMAQRVKMIGLAKQGKIDEALAGLDQQFRAGGLRNPEQTIDFALKMSAQAQLAGDYEAARDVLTRLSSAFFLNPYVRTLCENRLAKLELLGEDAPDVSASDLAGNSLDLSQWSGKVVIVDFWATNCPPCLEEFPSMKALYSEMHARGLEVAGISLDENAEVIEEFQKTFQLPWPLALSNEDQDRTRRRFRVVKIPSTFIIDRSGKIAHVDLTGADLRKAVEKLLAADKPQSGD